MTTQLDFPKLPRFEDMSINAVAMIVVSRVESSKARHRLSYGQNDFPDTDFKSQLMNVREDDKPEVPPSQDGIRIV
ncbi:MAG: hypothetical protein Q9226_008744, partial [Calogaya cf. arnoldii]